MNRPVTRTTAIEAINSGVVSFCFWGFVPRENVIGTPMFIYWSFETPRGEYLRTSLADRIGFFFRIVVHFFDQTRWSRMFHVVH